MTKEELKSKVEWEGGIGEAITGYGLKVTDLPDDVPPEVADAWYKIQESTTYIDLIDDWLYNQ